MRATVTRRYTFESAHWLPHVPESHKCHRIHGHNYEVDVEIEGTVDARGFVIDFFELDAIVAPLLAMVDHRTLNDVPGLENPTAELIAGWFLVHIDGDVDAATADARVVMVRCYETKNCWADAVPMPRLPPFAGVAHGRE